MLSAGLLHFYLYRSTSRRTPHNSPPALGTCYHVGTVDFWRKINTLSSLSSHARGENRDSNAQDHHYN